MKRSLRSLVLVAGMVSVTAFASNFALADDTAAPPAAPPTAAQGEGNHQHGFGKHHRNGNHARGEHFFRRLAKKLALTDQQSTQVKALFQQNRAQAKPIWTSLRTEKHNLHTLIASGTADEAAVRAQSAKVSSLEADLAVQRANGAKQLMALLTPDQQAKLKALQAKREQKFEKFRGDGPGSQGEE